MPRQARVESEDALHHVMSRGINRARIFEDDRDRAEFLARAEEVFAWAEAGCLAWALMPNHFHFALQRGKRSLSDVFRRLNTGYAMYFNRRHGRVGSLFGGRPKMKVVDSDAYLTELIRYVHLNPVKARRVTLGELDRFPWTGHAALLGHEPPRFLAVDRVLALFDETVGAARSALHDWMARGLREGSSAELTARLESSVGRKRQPGEADTRVIGDAAFTEKALAGAEVRDTRRVTLLAQGWTAERALARVCRSLGVDEALVRAGRRVGQASNARAITAWWAVETLGVTKTAVARLTGVGVGSISVGVRRGAVLAETLGLTDVESLPKATPRVRRPEPPRRPTLEALLQAVAELFELTSDAMRARGKKAPAADARRLFCVAAIREFGYGPTDVGRALGRDGSGAGRQAAKPVDPELLAELNRRLTD